MKILNKSFSIVDLRSYLFVSVLLLGLVSNAQQTNVTDMLGMTTVDDRIGTHAADYSYNFNSERSSLAAAGADFFMYTSTFTSNDIPSLSNGARLSIYDFKLNSNIVLEIGVVNHEGTIYWYSRRPTNIAGIGKSVNLDYRIYENLGVVGDFTFIIGKYFMAIAVDDGTYGFKLAPMLFGMDSNVGTLLNHMGEFTGSTSNGYTRSAQIYHSTDIWKMDGDAKIASFFNTINACANLDLITNTTGSDSCPGARVANMSADIADELNDVENGLNVYPNPSDGVFKLDLVLEESGNSGYQIFDLNGKTLIEESITLPKGNSVLEINKGGELSPGVYILELTAPGLKKTGRLIVE